MPEAVEFAGDHMTVTHDGDKTTVTFSDKKVGRVCGDCTLCCKLVPVPELRKPAGKKCQHVRFGKGCTIYAARPVSCRSWACRWLADSETAGMRRPDRAHYVIDLEDDFVTLRRDDGVTQKVAVVQVWADPAFPTAHREPELRAYMARMADQHNMATIVRWSSTQAVTVFPPRFDAAGEWHEIAGSIVARTPGERRILSINDEEPPHA